jgi:AcrR family transcriptional regulator
MARPTKYDDEELLESLRATFLECGPGATSAELARRAGVSEGTLFKRFGTKRRLFGMAMRLPALDEQAWFTSMQELAGSHTLDHNVRFLLRSMIAFIGEVVPVLESLQRSGAGLDELRDLLYVEGEEPPPIHLRNRVARYLARERDLGRLVEADSSALADFLMGAALAYAHHRVHFPFLVQESEDEYAARLAGTFVALASPHKAPRTPR